jgi:hypothetical protein
MSTDCAECKRKDAAIAALMKSLAELTLETAVRERGVNA